jgi:nitrogen PTS system EIIA component
MGEPVAGHYRLTILDVRIGLSAVVHRKMGSFGGRVQLTVRDVSRLFCVSEKTVYRWITQGKLPAYRVNEQFRFHRAELLEWASANRVNVSAELLTEPESSGEALPGLEAALRAGGVHYRLGGSDKGGVLAALVEIMPLPRGVDRSFLLQVLLARESLQSTGIGDGVAIPHPRSPIVLHIDEPVVTLCFLERPVDFGALDGKPVHALFSLVCPTARAHLHLLSRIAFALREPEFRALIDGKAGREAIVAAARRVDEALARPRVASEHP